jgi:hypothetical protein
MYKFGSGRKLPVLYRNDLHNFPYLTKMCQGKSICCTISPPVVLKGQGSCWHVKEGVGISNFSPFLFPLSLSLSSSLTPFPGSLPFLPFLLANPHCNNFGSARSRERDDDPGRGMKIQGEGGLGKVVAARIWIHRILLHCSC